MSSTEYVKPEPHDDEPLEWSSDPQGHRARVADAPIHPAFIRAPMPRYYTLPDGRRIERVPRPPHLSPPCASFLGVTFSVSGWPGVCAKHLKDTVVIDGANDAVLERHGWRATVLHLEWPGYDCQESRARIDVRPGGRGITRQTLAREIFVLLFNFHQTASKTPVSVGWEKWALTAGPEGIRVPDVVLLSIHYYRNAWVPEFYVIE